MKHTLSLLWLIAIPYLLSAQDFQSGTIVFSPGDSLDCDYKSQFSYKEEPYLLYRDPDSYELVKLEANKLIAFGNLDEGFWYICRKLKIEIDQEPKTRWLFLESIIRGRVNLYKTNDSRLVEHYFIENSEGKISELINRSYEELDAAKITRTHYDYAYLVTLQQSLMGCMEIAKNVKDYAFTEGALIQVVVDYHRCLETPYQKMSSTPNQISLPQIGVKLAFCTPFATTLPTASGNRNGFEAGLSIRWAMPRTREQFVLQVDGVYHQNWGLAKVSDQHFLAPISLIRISPLLQQQFRWDNHSIFINFGYDLVILGKNYELAYPSFQSQGYLRWRAIPKHFFGGAGYIYYTENGHLLQLESRIRFRLFLQLSLGASFYW